MRKGWHDILTPQRMITKQWQELTLLNTSPCHIQLWVSSGERRSSTCLDTIKMAWEDVLWIASIVSVPYSSLSASKPFHVVQFAHPSSWRGRRISVSMQLILNFTKKSKESSMMDKTCRVGCRRASDTVDLQRASPQPTAFFPRGLTLHFSQHRMCVVFGYYLCIVWGRWDGVRKKGDWS